MRSRAFLLLLLIAAGPRQEAAEKLAAAQRAQSARLAAQIEAARKSAAAQASADQLAPKLVQAAAALRSVEAGVAEAARRLREADAQAARADAGLRQRESELGALLPVVIRLARYPAETVLSMPGPPDQALLGLLVMRGLSAQIEQEAQWLAAQRAQAGRLHEQVAARAVSLASQKQLQASTAAALDRRIEAAQLVAAQTRDEAAIAAQAEAGFAAQAQTLRGVIQAMDDAERQAAARAARDAKLADRQKHTAQAQAARARQAALAQPAGPGLAAGLSVPVVGRVVRGWGAPAEDGPATGITYGATPGAVVTSPCAGRVEFAAPFRSYGRLMILACGGGYDFVLAGLDRLDASVGHAVRPGEPVGRLASAGPGPSLYVELRRDGQPVDPGPFFARQSR